MSNPPSLEQIVDAVLSEHDEILVSRLTWRPSAGARLFRREEPPENVKSAMLEYARGQGGLLAVLVEEQPYTLSRMTGAIAVESATRWADQHAPGIIAATWHGVCEEGELALIEIAGAEPGSLPGPGEMDVLEDLTLEALNPSALSSVLSLVRIPEPAYGWVDQIERDEAAMLAVRAAVRNRSEVVPTVAGLLAFGARPYKHIPGAKLVLRCPAQETLRGSLALMAREASRHPVLSEGLDARIVQELVLNALVHRDWSEAARRVPVLITRTPERLEITSPGSIGEGLVAPNPILRDLLRRMGLVPAEGNGVERLERFLRRCGAELRYAESRGEVRSIVELQDQASYAAVRAQPEAPRLVPSQRQPSRVLQPRRPTPPVASPRRAAPTVSARPPAPVASPRPQAPTVGAVQPASATSPEPEQRAPVVVPAAQPVSARSQRGEAILELLTQRGEMPSKALAETLGWSRSTVRDTLARLVDEGRIQRLASSPRSPEQAYSIREG